MSKIGLEDDVVYTDNSEWVESFADEESSQEDESDAGFGQDWRISLMSASLQALIYARFGGSVDVAIMHAEKLVHLYARPPQWANDLHDVYLTARSLAMRQVH